MFSESSRYYKLRELTHTSRDGRDIVYKERRLIPRLEPGGETTLAQSERLDLVAHRIVGNSEQFWKICDVNEELNPFELQSRSGRLLKTP